MAVDQELCPTCGDTADGDNGAAFCSNSFHVAEPDCVNSCAEVERLKAYAADLEHRLQDVPCVVDEHMTLADQLAAARKALWSVANRHGIDANGMRKIANDALGKERGAD